MDGEINWRVSGLCRGCGTPSPRTPQEAIPTTPQGGTGFQPADAQRFDNLPRPQRFLEG